MAERVRFEARDRARIVAHEARLSERGEPTQGARTRHPNLLDFPLIPSVPEGRLPNKV